MAPIERQKWELYRTRSPTFRRSVIRPLHTERLADGIEEISGLADQIPFCEGTVDRVSLDLDLAADACGRFKSEQKGFHERSAERVKVAIWGISIGDALQIGEAG